MVENAFITNKCHLCAVDRYRVMKDKKWWRPIKGDTGGVGVDGNDNNNDNDDEGMREIRVYIVPDAVPIIWMLSGDNAPLR